MVELADIFRRHGPAYRQMFKGRIPYVHLEAMHAIEHCRTETLGGHVYRCPDCEELRYAYHSCKNRSCPKCQNAEASQWIETQMASVLPVPYFMVTFTLPQELRFLARSHQKKFYGMMFRASAYALKKLALDPGHLGGLVGMLGVLQTWSRDFGYHPHIHYLVPGGALSLDESEWITPRYKDWLVPEKALAKIFQGKLRAMLKKAGFYDQVARRVWKKQWTVDCEPVGNGPEALKYLAPYIRRVALTNKRIKKLDNGQVTFQVKNRASKSWENRTLGAEEFIRRFLQHVLPKRFQKVRYYGFLHPNHKEQLTLIRHLLGPTLPQEAPVDDGDNEPQEHSTRAETTKDRCRKCGSLLVYLRRIPPMTRAPPDL
ncbi:IS91 family transposase [Acidobacteriota bacterium]